MSKYNRPARLYYINP